MMVSGQRTEDSEMVYFVCVALKDSDDGTWPQLLKFGLYPQYWVEREETTLMGSLQTRLWTETSSF
jgi:hypothetical protein